jgi:long-subunit fatty acid transport protein
MELRRVGGLGAALALLCTAGSAAASSALESPDGGVVQIGRGAAWFVRADDPTAAFFNPAAMAFQASGVHLGAELMFQDRCFTRQAPGGVPVSPGNNYPGPGTPPSGKTVPPPAATCAKGGLFPNPQIGGVFRITDSFALGVAVLGPHAYGKNEWPETLPFTNSFGAAVSQPAPQRYSLISANALLLFPTISAAYAPMDNLSFGAGIILGIATLEFSNFAESLRNDHSTPDNFNGDLHTNLKGKDLFVPGFILSTLWMPSKNLDLSAWYRWQDSVKTTSADLTTQANYWQPNGLKAAMTADTSLPGIGTVKLNIPMEAKIGVRYHQPREGGARPAWATKSPTRRVRDPMSEDMFDVELDFTWANDSAIDQLYLSFPDGQKINLGGATANLPTNGNIPHHFKDVVGVRLGGDFVVLPNRLSLRTGGFFETKGQDDAYIGLDFDAAIRAGVGGGASVRVGPVDISAAFQHTFYGTLDNGGTGNVHALSGDKDSCPVLPIEGKTCFRSQQAVNGGKLTASMNEIGLGATVRF